MSSISFIMHTNHFHALVRSTLSGSTSRRIVTESLHHAAVLVPLVGTDEGDAFLLTRRTHSVETHKGQISFPGGVQDTTDATVVDTALREAWEEIGLAPSVVEVVGELDDLATPTGFVITPVVGIISHLPELTVNREEVAEVFTVPVAFFTNRSHGTREFRVLDGQTREVWYYDTGTHIVWGATAAIVRSLLSRLRLL